MLRLRKVREAKGWSRARLAREAGVNASIACMVELGKLHCYPVQLARFAKALGIPAAQAGSLLEDVGDDTGTISSAMALPAQCPPTRRKGHARRCPAPR